MSEPHFSDDGLEALFDRDAARIPDDGFSVALFARLQRRARARIVTLTLAGAAGAAVAASQFPGLLDLYVSKARAVVALVPTGMIADAGSAAMATGGAQTASLAAAAAILLIAASGVMVLRRR